MKKNFNSERGRTTWEKVSPWYNKITQNSGHYYHEHVVIPGVLKLLDLKPGSKLLDVAAGSGVLGRAISKSLPAGRQGVDYLGVDVAPSLVAEAKRNDRNFNHKYHVADVTKPLNLNEKFTHAAIILALQNIKDPKAVLENISNLLIANGYLLIVLNHPAFRIPRQSSWGIDPGSKIQYRRIDRYMTPINIPITAHPGEKHSEFTWSYHLPLWEYSRMLKDNGFVIELIEEWTSDKESIGRAGKMENRSRAEIPLFMAILAKKI